MKKIVIALLATLISLSASSFTKTYADVIAVNGNSITLSTQMPYENMSALLLRTTSRGEYALAYLRVNKNRATIIDTDPLGGNPLATLKAVPKVGDRVIGGFLYNRTLILAPSKELEQKAKNRFGVATIESQLFQTYLKSSGKSANAGSYREFAKIAGIGLILLVSSSGVEVYDPISQSVIAKEHF
jgi:hypothetical protein